MIVPILQIIQARSTSQRLPGKIFEKIGDKTLLEWHIVNSAKCSISGLRTVLTMPYQEPEEKKIRQIASMYKVMAYSHLTKPRDVLKEFVMTADIYNPEWVVRTTADCPFICPKIMDRTIESAFRIETPVFNCYNEHSVVEVFRYSDLLRADRELPPLEECNDYQKKCREHVTMYFVKGFSKGSIDTKEDLERERQKWGERFYGRLM